MVLVLVKQFSQIFDERFKLLMDSFDHVELRFCILTICFGHAVCLDVNLEFVVLVLRFFEVGIKVVCH